MDLMKAFGFAGVKRASDQGYNQSMSDLVACSIEFVHVLTFLFFAFK